MDSSRKSNIFTLLESGLHQTGTIMRMMMMVIFGIRITKRIPIVLITGSSYVRTIYQKALKLLMRLLPPEVNNSTIRVDSCLCGKYNRNRIIDFLLALRGASRCGLQSRSFLNTSEG